MSDAQKATTTDRSGTTERDLLVAAKARLIAEGWRQDGRWKARDGNGPYCVLGVLGRVAHDAHRDPQPLKKRLADAAGIDPARPPAVLMGWNDTAARTFEEVIDAFDRAILAAAPPSPNRHSEQQGDTAHNPADSVPISRKPE